MTLEDETKEETAAREAKYWETQKQVSATVPSPSPSVPTRPVPQR